MTAGRVASFLMVALLSATGTFALGTIPNLGNLVNPGAAGAAAGANNFNPNDLLGTIISQLTQGTTAGTTAITGPGGTVINTGAAALGGVTGSLALLAAALKAPLVALYSISAEVVVMVALILFISYIASLLGIDDFRRRSGVAGERSLLSDIWNSEFVSNLSNSVTDAIENFDMSEVLERLDTRY